MCAAGLSGRTQKKRTKSVFIYFFQKLIKNARNLKNKKAKKKKKKEPLLFLVERMLVKIYI